ncbi:hypothetical protein [Pseudoroseomonas cervicalis]|uniref:hypothetical protein n=1 Tax=Teichococcus cervicalis TaxID=204525 RepID=UPI0022F19C17|nr:hypothetical protein [Pseudoroseomonas cervicalis]WBV42300.1 hypothetical protein PFY06_13795 [Pseudoroseomonas cervicalis]
MTSAADSLPHPELRRLAEALRQQPALAGRYAAATDLDSLAHQLAQDGYAVPRAALEQVMARSELSEAQLDQVQGGGALIGLLVGVLTGIVLSGIGVGIGVGVGARNNGHSSGEGDGSIGFSGRAD